MGKGCRDGDGGGGGEERKVNRVRMNLHVHQLHKTNVLIMQREPVLNTVKERKHNLSRCQSTGRREQARQRSQGSPETEEGHGTRDEWQEATFRSPWPRAAEGRDESDAAGRESHRVVNNHGRRSPAARCLLLSPRQPGDSAGTHPTAAPSQRGTKPA